MILIALIALIGATVNRIRGGGLTDIVRTKPKLKAFLEKIKLFGYKKEKKGTVYYVKDFNDLVFAYCFTFWMPLAWESLACFLLIGAGMRGGRSFGWGGYIESIVDEKINHDRDDILFLDKWFRGNDEAVLSGWAALSIRGLIWSALTYLGFYLASFFGYPAINPYAALIGLSMGTVYLFTVEVCERLTFRGNGWQYGELLFGSVFWGGFAIAIKTLLV